MWAHIQKQESQFRARRYKMKLSELIPIPGQINLPEEKEAATTDDIAENLEKLQQPNDFIDEFAINAIRTQETKATIYTPAFDHEKWVKQLEEDDEDECNRRPHRSRRTPTFSSPTTSISSTSTSNHRTTTTGSEHETTQTISDTESNEPFDPPDEWPPNFYDAGERYQENESSSTLSNEEGQIPSTPPNSPEDQNPSQYEEEEQRLTISLKSAL